MNLQKQFLVGAFLAAKEAANFIEINPSIQNGLPIIQGTRVPVHLILRAVEHYGSIDEAVRCYPQLTHEQIKDALCFAGLVVKSPSVFESGAPSR